MKTTVNTRDIFMDRAEQSLEKAKQEFNLACYLADCGSNVGLRKMWFTKADWLGAVIYLAEAQLADIKREREVDV